MWREMWRREKEKYTYIFRLTLERANYANSRNKLLKCVCEMQIEYEIYDLSAAEQTANDPIRAQKKHILSAVVWLSDARLVSRNCGNCFRAQIFRAGIFVFLLFRYFWNCETYPIRSSFFLFFYSSSYFSGVIFILLVSNLNADSENVIIKWIKNPYILILIWCERSSSLRADSSIRTRVWVAWYAQYTMLIYVYFCNADHHRRGEAVELDKIKSHFTAFFMRAPCAERTKTKKNKNWKWNVEYKAEEQRH